MHDMNLVIYFFWDELEIYRLTERIIVKFYVQ